MLDVVIVIVNFRTAGLAIDCLAALTSDPALPQGCRIVMVDGGSGDDSAGRLAAAIAERNWADRVLLVPLATNGGFAYGNNRGIEAAEAAFGPSRYVWLLNPDTVPRPGATTALLAFMDANPRAGIAGCRLEDPDGTPQGCAFRFPSIAGEFEGEIRSGPVSRLLGRWRIYSDLPDAPTRFDWLSGASMIVRREVFDQIGRLDERYFLYYEETDFCRRAAAAGWERWHVPASRVVHLVGQASGVTVRTSKKPRRAAYWFHSRNLYYLKHHGRLYGFAANLAWLLGQAGWKLRRRLERKPNEDPPRLVRDFIRIGGIVPKIER